MNNLSGKFTSDDGNETKVVAVSNDNYKLNLNNNYTLANHKGVKESKFTKKFKKSLIGADIGVKSSGFSSIAILATVIALAVVLTMYFLWRF